VRDGRLLGCVTTTQVGAVGEDQWDQRTVVEIVEPCSQDNIIAPEADTSEAMAKMQRTGRSPLLVVDRGQLIGVLSLRDLLDYLTLKLQFEGRHRRETAVQPQESYGH
jgi:CBS domain containing-hemolysin-like protein